jgi:hypothetical protein
MITPAQCPIYQAGLIGCDRCFLGERECYEECIERAEWWKSLIDSIPLSLDEIEENWACHETHSYSDS